MIRYSGNPIITRHNIPSLLPQLKDVSSVFNPGAIKFNDKYLLLLRVQNRGRQTFFVKALSDDGINFTIDTKPVEFTGLHRIDKRYFHFSDPRITFIEDRYFILFTIDFVNFHSLGLAVTDDFENYEFITVAAEWNTGNGVIFPEKFNDKYYRLERPNVMRNDEGIVLGKSIVLSESDDMIYWRIKETVMEGRLHYWDEIIGSGAPPVKTKEGWLHIYHGTATYLAGVNIFQAGVVLLDLENPARVVSRGKYNILEPRELYEMVGFVPNVVFPCGMIVDNYDENGYAELSSKVFLYYGAADTCVGLVTTTIQELIEHARAGNE